MANAGSVDKFYGGAPNNPVFQVVADFTIDTYVAGGVDMKDLLATALAANKLPAEGVFSGSVAMDLDAASVAYVGEFLPDSGKLVLKKVVSGALVEETAGAITAVNGKLTLQII